MQSGIYPFGGLTLSHEAVSWDPLGGCSTWLAFLILTAKKAAIYKNTYGMKVCILYLYFYEFMSDLTLQRLKNVGAIMNTNIFLYYAHPYLLNMQSIRLHFFIIICLILRI